MNNITEIKAQLEIYYQEYKENKNTMNASKTQEASKLIADIVSSEKGSPCDAAYELTRFPSEVSKVFFDTLSKSKALPFNDIESVLKELLASDINEKLSQSYAIKFVFALVPIIRCYKDEAFHSPTLPYLVEYIALFVIKSEKNKNKFYSLINQSSGEVFNLDYSALNKENLANIWKAINTVYPDYNNSRYKALIMEWGKRYNFIQDDASKEQTMSDQSVKTENVATSNGAAAEKNKADDVQQSAKDSDSDQNAYSDSYGTENAPPKDVHTAVRGSEKDTLIKAITGLISPIEKKLESMQGEINKSRELGAENISLKTRVEELEQQLSEQRIRLQATSQSLITATTENNELKKQISSLESQNSELDIKLNDAYAINSRESSLEAEKIRAELKKAFAFLYEDWLEYEFSDVSEENYESLQAIIKKIFRSLERNGIDFKGNDQ